MAVKFPNLVGETGTFKTAGTLVELSGTAPNYHRTFAQTLTDGDITSGDTVFVVLKKDTTTVAVWEATWNDLATDTIVQVTALTSIGTLANDDAVEVFIINFSTNVEAAWWIARREIVGATLFYTNHTTVQLGPGACMVDNVWASWTSNISSGVLGQLDAGLSATGRWNWYLYWTGSAWDVEYSQTEALQAADYSHWYKTGDTSRRLMGWHTVYDNGGTREIFLTWKTNSVGNTVFVSMEGDSDAAIPTRVVSDTTPVATGFTAVGTTAGGTWNPTDLVPPNAVSLSIKAAFASRVASGGAFSGYISISENNALNKAYAGIPIRISHDITTTDNFFLPPTKFYVLDPHTWYYACTETTGTFTAIIDIVGAVMQR